MDIFCAYFDVQGFYIDKIFHPIEVCMASKKETLHVNFVKIVVQLWSAFTVIAFKFR